MPNHAQKITYLRDYTKPSYLVESVELRFELDEQQTIVHSCLHLRRNGPRPLILDGQQLTLRRVELDGRALTITEYTVDDESLTIHQTPDSFTLQVETTICPKDNTALEGLYASGGNLCTQCEAEGFRRITYYTDRPDVMAPFSTTLIADPIRYPILLSNGNPAARGVLPDGRHYVRWEDPFPKPCYLFALVAGDLAHIHDTYITNTGREVALSIYVQPQNRDQCNHAMVSLKKAMRWDEETYGREYDLEVYQIVAVDDFNMGAMENKGLNIFNSRYVLASPESATDDDFESIEAVIAHEYFHNWSGNRVTCRDWFQLSLKEGFTVFRDQEFTAAMTSPAVKRIKDAIRLRAAQFREDAGPLAHPVRPESYVEINNFYTVTVYEKGAEVVRMARNLLGSELFRRGTDLYFARHDGQAVTTDDFLHALEEASGRDLQQFRRWYTQAGTPELTCQGHYDAVAQTYTLTIDQHCPPTPGQKTKDAFHLPLAMGLLDRNGAEIPLYLAHANVADAAPLNTIVLELRQPHEVFQFTHIASPPLPSLLRDFSAPVKLNFDYTDADLAFLMARDSDLFNRWEAGQQLALRLLKNLLANYAAGLPLAVSPLLLEAMTHLLEISETDDRRLLAEALTLPSEAYLAESVTEIDPAAIHYVRRFLRRALAETLREKFSAVYHANQKLPSTIGKRRLKNICLGYLMELNDAESRELCVKQLHTATNMTDTMAALSLLANTDCAERLPALAEFYHHWHHHSLVLDKWFALQATSYLPGTLATVRGLLAHPDFRLTNPNKVRAVIGAFCHNNPINFHDLQGMGYEFLAEQVLILDPLNPQIASRLLHAISDWRRYEPLRRAAMRKVLERIMIQPILSKDIYEIASKALTQN